MARYLREDEFSDDSATIGFPGMLLCMGVVVMTKPYNNLFGVHIPYPGPNTLNVVTQLSNTMPPNHKANIRVIYGSCHLQQRYNRGDPDANLAAWKAEMRQIAAIFGWNGLAHANGDLRGFDTSNIPGFPGAPGIGGGKTGAYVEYEADYEMLKCKIFHKLDQKMNQIVGATPANTQSFSPKQGLKQPMFAVTNDSVSPGNGGLDEADYSKLMRAQVF